MLTGIFNILLTLFALRPFCLETNLSKAFSCAYVILVCLILRDSDFLSATLSKLTYLIRLINDSFIFTIYTSFNSFINNIMKTSSGDDYIFKLNYLKFIF